MPRDAMLFYYSLLTFSSFSTTLAFNDLPHDHSNKYLFFIKDRWLCWHFIIVNELYNPNIVGKKKTSVLSVDDVQCKYVYGISPKYAKVLPDMVHVQFNFALFSYFWDTNNVAVMPIHWSIIT